MNQRSRRAADYLRHILDAIERIGVYTAGLNSADELERNGIVLDAVVRNLEICGEAAVKIERDAPALVESSGDIPWKLMRTMRNKMIHSYFEVDAKVVWATIRIDLPALRPRIEALLAGGLKEE